MMPLILAQIDPKIIADHQNWPVYLLSIILSTVGGAALWILREMFSSLKARDAAAAQQNVTLGEIKTHIAVQTEATRSHTEALKSVCKANCPQP